VLRGLPLRFCRRHSFQVTPRQTTVPCAERHPAVPRLCSPAGQRGTPIRRRWRSLPDPLPSPRFGPAASFLSAFTLYAPGWPMGIAAGQLKHRPGAHQRVGKLGEALGTGPGQAAATSSNQTVLRTKTRPYAKHASHAQWHAHECPRQATRMFPAPVPCTYQACRSNRKRSVSRKLR
jgi:hypothetical protein